MMPATKVDNTQIREFFEQAKLSVGLVNQKNPKLNFQLFLEAKSNGKFSTQEFLYLKSVGTGARDCTMTFLAVWWNAEKQCFECNVHGLPGSKLPDAVKWTTIDEFRTVLLGLHNAFFHLEGMPLPKNQALAVQWALEKIQSWAIFGFDAALPVIEALNNAGLNTSTPPCRSDSR
jgi:hypothetical protein